MSTPNALPVKGYYGVAGQVRVSEWLDTDKPLCLVSDALAAIAAASAVPPVYRLVPIEPTPEMIEAGGEVDGARDGLIRCYWKSMCLAAPQPPSAAITPEFTKAKAVEWHGQAGGELLPQLTANELAGILNERDAAIAAASAVPPCQNESMGQHACKNRAQCWEPCGELGHSAEHARVSRRTPPSAAMQPLTCIWTEQDDDDMPGTYASACGEMWSFNDGGVVENNVRFCQGCGKPVEVRDITKAAP